MAAEEVLRRQRAAQHEAMACAVQLHERNTQLQAAMRAVDRAVLTVRVDYEMEMARMEKVLTSTRNRLEATQQEVAMWQEEVQCCVTANHALQLQLASSQRDARSLLAQLHEHIKEQEDLQRKYEDATSSHKDFMITERQLLKINEILRKRIFELETISKK
ncbi:uncharacterized protein LOC134538566 [Bacillus rossius redtenbacheri]|uniref:uncharacterized protein LOC134538566 n=1 Tax=Bacillus rossius redtenbacheri TaxID=93214 RepID=UPI002FDDC52F